MKIYALLAGLCFLLSGSRAQDPVWLTDASAAMAKARQTHRLVLVDFSNPDDMLSRRFDENVLKDDSVVGMLKLFVILRLDPTRASDLVQRYSVGVLPTTLFLTSDGKLVSQQAGYETTPDFMDTIQTARASFLEFADVKKKLDSHPADGEANAKFATFVTLRSAGDNAPEPSGAAALKRALDSAYRGPYLLRALEAVGDAYASLPRSQGRAVDCYTKAVQFAKTPVETARALAGLMYLQVSTDKKAAKLTAQRLIDLKGATPEWVYAAHEVLDSIAAKER